MNLRDLFGHDNGDGTRRWKWWTIELRFARVLRRREWRILQADDCLWGVPTGRDGAHGTWASKWPGQEDVEWVLRLLLRIGVEAWVRAAPEMPLSSEMTAGQWNEFVRGVGIGRHRRLPEEWFVFDPLARTVRLGVSSPPFSHWEWSR